MALLTFSRTPAGRTTCRCNNLLRICRVLKRGLLLALSALLTGAASLLHSVPQEQYESRQAHSPDGIGKFYYGREIAQVMGHQGAEWLERPEREEEERPDLLLRILKLKKGQFVADVGAGSGYLSCRLAEMVGSGGRVYAVDIQPEMLDLVRSNTAKRALTNVVPVLGSVTNTGLAVRSIDLALMVDVYHEFSHPYEMMQDICRSLKSNGRAAFVEYRPNDPRVPIKPLHTMSEIQLRKEMAELPLQWVETLTNLPRQQVIVFRKTAGKRSEASKE